jgi:chromosome segregation ATPase
MHVDDVRKEERQWRQRREDAQRQERNLIQQENSLKAELDMISASLAERIKQDLADQIADLEKDIEKLQNDGTTMDGNKKQLEEHLASYDENVSELKDKQQDCQKRLLECREELEKVNLGLAEEFKKVIESEADLQVLHEKRKDLLSQSEFEGVDLPLYREIGGRRVVGREALRELVTSSHTTEAWQQHAAEIVVDFSTLDADKQLIVDCELDSTQPRPEESDSVPSISVVELNYQAREWYWRLGFVEVQETSFAIKQHRLPVTFIEMRRRKGADMTTEEH